MKLKRVIAASILFCSFVITPCALALGGAEEVVESTSIPDESEIIIIIPQTDTADQQSDYVYTTDNVNIRTKASIDSDILITAEAGTKLHRVGTNIESDWDAIEINNKEYYIFNEFISTDEPENIADSIEQQLEDNKISASDLRYMSAIVWAEAGNQCEAGQQAVGIVVMNRVKSKVYKDTVYDVINEPYQFSPVRNGSFAKALNYYDSGKMPECVINAARYALQGNTTVNYNGEIYDLDGYLYFSRYVSGCRLKIQDHMFK